MTVILCSKTPQDISAERIESRVAEFFCAEDNREYFEALKKHKSDEGVKESFFALAILAKAIDMLPEHFDREKLILKKSASGKPYFDGSALQFSISHSKGKVVCAASDRDCVGVDIECSEISADRAKKLAKRYFCKEDADEVDKKPEVFKKLWCEKEAATKFFGGELADHLKSRDQAEKSEKIAFYSFKWENDPIVLCSKGANSTIVFKIF